MAVQGGDFQVIVILSGAVQIPRTGISSLCRFRHCPRLRCDSSLPMVPSTQIRPVDAELQSSIAEIADHFAIEGDFIEGREIVSGHINSTYRATFEKAGGVRQRYILQKINAHVFKDPIAVMRNVECVTRHINWKVLRVKKDMGGQTLNLYPGRGGKAWVVAPDGGVWRCYNSIEGCVTYDIIENTRQAYQAAKAFGSFQDLVSDLPASSVEETIPGFHDTRKRYQALRDAIAADPLGRAAG
ncbi:MAG: aminoglycoside phosphotransferase, partial [Akkermansiaceae bacterium]|nr:aminoglycoside phosphotransferase [Akkermansiaceae bacterium]